MFPSFAILPRFAHTHTHTHILSINLDVCALHFILSPEAYLLRVYLVHYLRPFQVKAQTQTERLRQHKARNKRLISKNTDTVEGKTNAGTLEKANNFKKIN